MQEQQLCQGELEGTFKIIIYPLLINIKLAYKAIKCMYRALLMKISTGIPYPLGATFTKNGVNFAVFTDSDEEIFLCFFNEEDLIEEILIPYKTGKLRHCLIQDLSEKATSYAYRIKYNEKESPIYFLDPYATALKAPLKWEIQQQKKYAPSSLLINQEPFDWEGDVKPNLPMSDLVIYEMHVRGFTQDPSSNVEKKGTFLGVIEKIPHLLDLGVNAVELLPIFEFNENEYSLSDPLSGKPLSQYWGYSTVNFFSPMNRYVFSEERGAGLKEIKTLVKELHKQGIEVILDVVFNHTAEGNAMGPNYCFKGLANNAYYMMNGPGDYMNFTGCGNTFNCNFPIVRQFILSCLRYWVAEMHIDGFRFDLASIFYRGSKGEFLQNPPLLDAIAEDPILANTKLIAEPWDAGGLYQVGSFYLESKRFSEWNGRFRDCARKFIKGDKHLKGEFATRLCGSQDLYDQKKSPAASVNFITSHDGFSLRDLVSYNGKHNQNNGEDNRDGENNNISWNSGIEGPTDNSDIIALRERQMRNFHLVLMASQGVPMLSMGDEYGHTKNGNNNSWCQDNELNWFLWDMLEKNQDFYNFYKGLIRFRKNEPLLKRKGFLKDDDIEWHGILPSKPCWDKDDRFIAFTLIDEREGNDLYVAINSSNQDLDVTFPEKPAEKYWHWIANTSEKPPNDLPTSKPKIETKHYKMLNHSALILKAY